jgi:HEAT repeat protein
VLLVLVLPSVVELTVGLTVVSLVLSVVMAVVIVERHVEWARGRRRRERLRRQLEPLLAGMLESGDPAGVAGELLPRVVGLRGAGRAVAGSVLVDLIGRVPSAQRELIRRALAGSMAVALIERGTRRRTPWRRALACQVLGQIGGPASVPVLLERLDDRRLEVRIAAVHALGEIGSPEAAPALTAVFLSRGGVPSSVLNDALRRLGAEGAAAFEQGVANSDVHVRVSSCFGIAASTTAGALAAETAERLLVSRLAGDRDGAVRTAAAAALGIIGGAVAPAELCAASADGDVRVRRAAVKALGAFDDLAAVEQVLATADDLDRETAIRSAEALLRLSRMPRAGARAREGIDASSAWSVAYAQAVAEVSG